MKKKFNKKLYLIFALLIFVIVLIISCKKFNILGPTYIPPETYFFRFPEDTIPSHIDVTPVPAKDGEVFGGFQRKFKYQGKWYILADYMYEYKPENKTLTQKAYGIILQIDDDGNIIVYDKSSMGYYECCYYMNVIEEDRVLYEPYYYGSYFSPTDSYITKSCEDIEFTHLFNTGIIFNNEIRTSSDLVNWKTEGKVSNIYKSFPLPNPNNPNASFQGGFGVVNYRIVGFKDYIYVIGLEEDFFEQNPTGCRNTDAPPFSTSKDVYYRVHKNKNSSVGSNWEKIPTPWGERSNLTVRYDKNKIYVTKGERAYYELGDPKWDYKTESFSWDNTIWSTTDGVNWQKEPNSSAYNKANSVYLLGGDLPYIANRIKTPEEPNWIKLNDGRYYKSDNSPYETYRINNKYYYVPIPPYEEIKAAYNSGQEYFTITEEHIKSAGLNQFLTKDKEPNEDEDWAVITPIDYTDKLMVWQSGGEKVMFNINDKAVQLVDYEKIEYMYNTVQDYSIVINDFREIAKEYRDEKNVYLGMQYDARADMLELMMNNREYIMPDVAITHYSLEFKYY